jgi:hypothetical protein
MPKFIADFNCVLDAVELVRPVAGRLFWIQAFV